MTMQQQTVDAAKFLLASAHCADPLALPNPHALFWSNNADPVAVAEFVRTQLRYPVIEPICHLGVFSYDLDRCGIVLVHNVTPYGDAELFVLSLDGLCWTRPAVRSIARWIFCQLDLRRITLRIRADNLKARDYAHRLGFRHEGIQRRWFADDVDASLWAMHRSECPWLIAQLMR
jgi:hypothetical protein